MKRTLLFFLLLLFYPFLSFSQLTQTIKGSVVDKDSKTPLQGVSVMIMNLNPVTKVLSDNNGFFRIEKVPVGRYNLKIMYQGYDILIIPDILVSSGKEEYLNIELTESVSQLSEVTITDKSEKGRSKNEMAVVSARTINVEEATRNAGNFNGDISRIAQSYAGVAGSGLTNEIVIRGNSPKGLLWRLEGIEVPNLNHLAENGTSGGGLSILSVNVLKNSDFYTGAFPAEYGNALSGVFDVRLRTGNNEKQEYSAQAGFMGLEATMEGPFTKKSKASYLVNYRYSTSGLLNLLGLNVSYGALPKFHDLTLKLNFPTEKAGLFTIFGVGGISSLTTPGIKDSIKWKSDDSRYENASLSNMFASGIIHKYFFNSNAFLTSYISVSGNSNGGQVDSLDNEYQFHSISKNIYAETALRISTALNNKLNVKNTLRTGIIFSLNSFDLQSENKSTREIFINNKGRAEQFQFYSQWKHRFRDKVTLNTGFHSNYYSLNSNLTFEPRLSLQWNYTPKQSICIGTGLYSRLEPLTFYFAQVYQPNGTFTTPNNELKSSKALHFVLSYNNQLTQDIQLKTEFYYQYLFDVPVENKLQSGFSSINYGSLFASIDNNINVPFINKGTGTNYGMEFTVEKFFSKNYYFLSTVSLYESKYKALDGIERNTRYNNNFINNIVGGKEFKTGKNKTNAIVTDFKMVWSGGNPLTPVNLEQSRLENKTVYELDKRYSQKAPLYFRLDYKIGFRKNKKKSSHYLFLDVQNVTNRKNIYTKYYDPVAGNIKTIYQLGLIPILNYRVQF